MTWLFIVIVGFVVSVALGVVCLRFVRIKRQTRQTAIAGFRGIWLIAMKESRYTILDIEHRHLMRQRDKLRQLANTYDDQLHEQIRLSGILLSCSPYAVFNDVAMTLANTSGEPQIAFLKMTRRYEDDYFDEQYAKKRVIHHFVPVEDPPLFYMTIPNLRERIQQSLSSVGLLVVFGIFFFMAGYLLFLRHPLERV